MDDCAGKRSHSVVIPSCFLLVLLILVRNDPFTLVRHSKDFKTDAFTKAPAASCLRHAQFVNGMVALKEETVVTVQQMVLPLH